MPQYMLLCHGDPSSWQKLSAEEKQKAQERYMAWTRKTFTRDSKQLASDPGRVIRSGEGQPRVADGPYSETKEILGGYYMIEATNYDDAVRLCADHPQLSYGGTIELRQVLGS